MVRRTRNAFAEAHNELIFETTLFLAAWLMGAVAILTDVWGDVAV